MATTKTTIRPMTPADADPAAAVVLAGGWGDRQLFFRFVTAAPACRPLVAVADGEIVGTGIGTANGPVGWVGTIFVTPGHRGRGLGMALTQAVVDALGEAGCRTLVLVATEQGRPMYERLGFELQTTYRTLEAPGLPDAGPPDRRIRPFRRSDLDAMALLDRAATGEDRRHLLDAFATEESARCLVRPDGTLGGFVVRAPWGGGATVAPDADDASAILEARRRAAGPERRVRAGVIAENEAGYRRLTDLGWTDAWSAPRLVRGVPLEWNPLALWGQFNHALG
jgi:GNAT superfamily N-acetyltransferase